MIQFTRNSRTGKLVCDGRSQNGYLGRSIVWKRANRTYRDNGNILYVDQRYTHIKIHPSG